MLELGCGVSALLGLAVAPLLAGGGGYLLTDQAYVGRLVERNIAENLANLGMAERTGGRRRDTKGSVRPKPKVNVRFHALDWETDAVTRALLDVALGDVDGDGATASHDDGARERQSRGFDLVIASDCIYNESLITPFVQTCADACRLRRPRSRDDAAEQQIPTICLVAQQLRDPDVFETWLRRFCESFAAWRVPDSELPSGLKSTDGFVIHLGILKTE